MGDATEYGKVFEGVQIDNSVKTLLNEQLDHLAGMITKISWRNSCFGDCRSPYRVFHQC